MRRYLVAVLLVGAFAVGGCGSEGPEAPDAPAGGTTGAGQPPAEPNPAGDIPDNQAFVAYRSGAGGFEVKVPEGWARADSPGGITFSDHLNTVQVTWQPAPTPPSVERANTRDVPELQKTAAAFTLTRVGAVTLPAGPAVLIESQENSPPNSVTGKQYRLDVRRYVLGHGQREAVLLLSSPAGADNVDSWKLVAESFRWQ